MEIRRTEANSRRTGPYATWQTARMDEIRACRRVGFLVTVGDNIWNRERTWQVDFKGIKGIGVASGERELWIPDMRGHKTLGEVLSITEEPFSFTVALDMERFRYIPQRLLEIKDRIFSSPSDVWRREVYKAMCATEMQIFTPMHAAEFMRAVYDLSFQRSEKYGTIAEIRHDPLVGPADIANILMKLEPVQRSNVFTKLRLFFPGFFAADVLRGVSNLGGLDAEIPRSR